jgi:hypothetical protein
MARGQLCQWGSACCRAPASALGRPIRVGPEAVCLFVWHASDAGTSLPALSTWPAIQCVRVSAPPPVAPSAGRKLGAKPGERRWDLTGHRRVSRLQINHHVIEHLACVQGPQSIGAALAQRARCLIVWRLHQSYNSSLTSSLFGGVVRLLQLGSATTCTYDKGC